MRPVSITTEIAGYAILLGINVLAISAAYFFIRLPDKLLRAFARYNAWAWHITNQRGPFPMEEALDPARVKSSPTIGFFRFVGWFFVVCLTAIDWEAALGIWHRYTGH